MTFLTLLLLFKIVVTGVPVSLPLLLMPGAWVQARMGIGADGVPLARLYGVAVTALLVGYAGGIGPAQAGVFPWGVVVMGIASNAGATLCLLVTGGWRLSRAAPVLFGGITLALVAAAVWPGVALRQVF